MWFSVVSTLIENDSVITVVKTLWTHEVQQIELHHKARALLSTSAAYTHGQIVDAELANQSARFALVML